MRYKTFKLGSNVKQKKKTTMKLKTKQMLVMVILGPLVKWNLLEKWISPGVSLNVIPTFYGVGEGIVRI